MSIQPKDILDFWFEQYGPEDWFSKNEAFDQLIKVNFLNSYEEARTGVLHEWLETPDSLLAKIIVLDQFSRNMFRGDKRMYQADHLACFLSYLAIEKSFDQQFDDDQKLFIYLPLMHSEILKDQETCVAMIQNMDNIDMSLDYAIQHRDIVKEYGRFPHRNEILGRLSTPKELEFLKKEGSSF